MITLTTPHPITVVIGGSTQVNFDKFVLSSFTFNPIDRVISGRIRISSTTETDMSPLQGSFSLETSGERVLEINIPQLDIQRRIILTVGQAATASGWIDDTQDTLENGLVSIGVVAGTQSTGT